MINTRSTNSMRGSRNFCQGGSRSEGQKTAWTTFFFSFKLLNLFYSLQRGSNGFISEKTIIFKGGGGGGGEGGPTFSKGGGGPNANFYRNPYKL